MSRTRTLGSVFWALALVAFGGVLLVRNMGYEVPIVPYLAVYWPVLIIAWGLVKVVDYFRFRGERTSVFSGGEVVFLIFVVIAGASLTAAANIGSDPGFLGILGEDFDFFDVLGENHEFTSELSAPIESGRVIEIVNRYGGVDVQTGPAGMIDIEVRKTIRATSLEAAEELEPELNFTVQELDGRYVVNSNRDELRERTRRRFRTSLSVTVPADSSIDVDNSYGAVRIAGLTGDQVVDNRYGAVTLDEIDGNVRIEDRYGPVAASVVSGDVVVDNRYGGVNLNGIGGEARVQNRYAPVELRDIGGRVVVNNRYSSVEVRDTDGDVQIDGRNNHIELENVSGALDVDTSYRNVSGRNVSGRIAVANRHGDVLLRFDEAPEESLTVTGDYTDVRLEMPLDSEFSLDTQILSGAFDSDFDSFDRDASRRDLRVTGQQGAGGPTISIRTARGDVRLVGR